ncbi:transcription factor Maf isoform X3 [Diachasma alloeum]|uniref:transcription factor Maf isoform X3 n=1 Tax=Diachasma alloeum TaxID=454923 RepID=UPI0007381584|nr:transcription factor Maf isoform X3 [Diachasma alloeum]
MNRDTAKSRKTRSASICAPGFSSMEQILSAVSAGSDIKGKEEKKEREGDSGTGTPDSGSTPTRRRRPATRSQSARVSGGSKSIRRKAAAQAANHHYQHHHHHHHQQQHHQQQQQQHGGGMKSPHCSSEPRLTDNDISPGLRRRGSRRGQSMHHVHYRKSNAFLDVPDINVQPPQRREDEDEESYRLRSFSLTSKDDVPSEQSVFVMLNGEESELKFENITNLKTELDQIPEVDAFIIMYSVIDKSSFQRVEEYLTQLHDRDLLRTHPVILVGNKVDLVRSRAVSIQDGKCIACTYRAKFIEISVGINHNVDDLLVGILNQIRLKNRYLESKGANSSSSESTNTHWYKSRGVIRASMKARQMLTWLFGKENSKFKNCENLHVL